MLISLKTLTHLGGSALELMEEMYFPELSNEVRSMIRMSPMQIKAKVSQEGTHRFQIEVEQSAQATFVCSRCLKEFDLSINTTWDEHFTDLPVKNEEESDLHPVDKQLDLRPWIREAFLLQVPFAPICKEKCRGLCPMCGINRNEAICTCNTAHIDPRLAKLQEFGKQDT